MSAADQLPGQLILQVRAWSQPGETGINVFGKERPSSQYQQLDMSLRFSKDSLITAGVQSGCWMAFGC